jgi:hypothetical protein
MLYLVMKACKSRLLGKRLLSCEPQLTSAAGQQTTSQKRQMTIHPINYSRVFQLTDETVQQLYTTTPIIPDHAFTCVMV